MSTTVQDLRRWFEDGVKDKFTHMIVVCDTFDYEDYPVYVSESEDVRVKETEYNQKNMQRVMEVYDLRKPMKKQMEQGRAFNY